MKLNKILHEIEINIKAWAYLIFEFPVKIFNHMKEKDLNLFGAIEYEVLQLEHEEEKLRKKYEEEKKMFKEKIVIEVEKILKKKGIMK
jgi:hypothetical protein